MYIVYPWLLKVSQGRSYRALEQSVMYVRLKHKKNVSALEKLTVVRNFAFTTQINDNSKLHAFKRFT
jgi:hypothetical protein